MHIINFRIYYEDTDAGGVVYHANYLNFAERARTEWLRNLGFEQPKLDVIFVVRKVEIEYLSPAMLDDEITVQTSLQNIGRASITLNQDFYKDGKILAKTTVVLVTVSRDIKVVSIPHEIKSKLTSE